MQKTEHQNLKTKKVISNPKWVLINLHPVYSDNVARQLIKTIFQWQNMKDYTSFKPILYHV